MNLFSGNSIARGYGVSVPEKTVCALLSASTGRTFTNVAVDGHMVPDQAGPTYTNLVTAGGVGCIITGTNDDRAYGNDALKRQIFIDGLRAMIVYQATNRKNARLSTSGVTWAGGNWYDNVYTTHGIGRATTAAPATATFTFNGDVLYLGMIRQAGNTGSIKIMEGSTDKGTYTLGGAGITYVQAATTGYDYGPKCIRIPGFGAGSHTVQMQILMANVYFDWYAEASKFAAVLVANIPYARLYQSGGSSATVDLANAAIAAMVAELQADGLDVRLVDINGLLTMADMDADYHPNDVGHQKMADAFKAQYDIIFPPPLYTFSPVNTYRRSDGLYFIGDGINQRQIVTA